MGDPADDILIDELESRPTSNIFVYTLVCSVLGFQCYNFALNFVPAPGKYAAEDQRYKWRNVMTSFVHASITGTMSLFCICTCPELFGDMIHNSNLIAEQLLAITGGYFIYDTYDLLTTGKLSNQLALIIHHIICAPVFLGFLFYKFCVPCCVITLLVEVNSTFLHGRQLIIMYGISKTTLFFRAVNAVNIATFLFLRFGVIIFIYSFMIYQWPVLPTVVSWIFPPIWTVVAVINVVLFFRLLRSDVLVRNKKDKEKEILVTG